MTDRPTPEEIASTYKGGVRVLRRLERYGYVIVHPDDVPDAHDSNAPTPPLHLSSEGCFGWESGWNACRAHIFGGDA